MHLQIIQRFGDFGVSRKTVAIYFLIKMEDLTVYIILVHMNHGLFTGLVLVALQKMRKLHQRGEQKYHHKK